MAKFNSEQERQRLAEFYSRQMNGELEQVAAQAYELTELARQALRAEPQKRGLDLRLREQLPLEPPAPPQPGDPPPGATLHGNLA